MAGGGTWTTPRTWTAGEIVTKAILDTHVRDNLNALTPAATTITTTGTQADLAIPTGRGNLILFCNNASALTINSLDASNAHDGQRLLIYAIGVGNVSLAHETGATASNRIFIPVLTTWTLVGGAGFAEVIYDATTARWRGLTHQQGDFITFATTWAGGSGTAISNGTLTMRYLVDGRRVHWDLYLLAGSSTNFGDGTAWTFTVPIASKSVSAWGQVGSAVALDAAPSYRFGGALMSSTTTISFAPDAASALYSSSQPFTWAQNDLLRASGYYPIG